jgi:hypothetical protein
VLNPFLVPLYGTVAYKIGFTQQAPLQKEKAPALGDNTSLKIVRLTSESSAKYL